MTVEVEHTQSSFLISTMVADHNKDALTKSSGTSALPALSAPPTLPPSILPDTINTTSVAPIMYLHIVIGLSARKFAYRYWNYHK